MTVIDDIINKCEEIEDQTTFIKTLAGKATDPKWVANDPGYAHSIAVYSSAKTKLAQIVSQLP